MNSDTEDDERGENAIVFELGSRPKSNSNQSLRNRLFAMASVNGGSRIRDKPICTTPGKICAGETETETDEPVSFEPQIMIHKHDSS